MRESGLLTEETSLALPPELDNYYLINYYNDLLQHDGMFDPTPPKRPKTSIVVRLYTLEYNGIVYSPFIL